MAGRIKETPHRAGFLSAIRSLLSDRARGLFGGPGRLPWSVFFFFFFASFFFNVIDAKAIHFGEGGVVRVAFDFALHD